MELDCLAKIKRRACKVITIGEGSDGVDQALTSGFPRLKRDFESISKALSCQVGTEVCPALTLLCASGREERAKQVQLSDSMQAEQNLWLHQSLCCCLFERVQG